MPGSAGSIGQRRCPSFMVRPQASAGTMTAFGLAWFQIMRAAICLAVSSRPGSISAHAGGVVDLGKDCADVVGQRVGSVRVWLADRPVSPFPTVRVRGGGWPGQPVVPLKIAARSAGQRCSARRSRSTPRRIWSSAP
jgi:hypothetical protein